MICAKCRATIEDDSKFCKICGAPCERPTFATPPSTTAPTEAAGVMTAAAGSPRAADAYRDPALEKQVWEGRPAWRAYYGIWAAWVIGSILLFLLAHQWQAGPTIHTAIWLLVGATGLALLVREALVILGQRYRLTTQRLFLHRGLLTQVTDQLELVRVDDVRLRQGIVDRLVNTGDIEIISSDQTDEKLTLQSVFSPAEVAEHVRRNVRSARGKGSLFVENV